MSRRASLLLAVALLVAAPAARAEGPYGDQGGFFIVLALGHGQTVTPAGVAAYGGAGTPPPPFVNQYDMSSAVSRGADKLTTGTLDRYWKPSSFRTPQADNG